MSTESGPKRTVFILYIPGGGMLGIIPAMVLSRLETLTETPAGHLFQVLNGVSTGSILAAGLSVRDPKNPTQPKLNAEQSNSLFQNLGPKFFPYIPARMAKMVVASLSNLVADQIDPPKAEANLLEDIRESCRQLKELTTGEDRKIVEKMEALALSRWLSPSNKAAVLKLCTHFHKKDPKVADLATYVGELVYFRSTTKMLSRVFRQAVLGGLNICRKHWAHDFFYSSEIPKQHFRELWGETSMSKCLRSTYISAYNLQDSKMETFFTRKKDLFSLDPNAPAVTSKYDAKLWDAVMASVANPFAFRPHHMENGTICSDKAIMHTPLPCVTEILAHKPKDADIKLVMMSTGKYLSKQKSDSAVSEEQERYGVIANLMRGKETTDLENYNMSSARPILDELLGKDNVFEFSARLSPRDPKEAQKLPSRDILDASELNIKAIARRAEVMMRDEDEGIRNLALMLAENLHNLGQMDDAKFERVKQNVQVPYVLPPEDPALEKLAAINRGEQVSEELPTLTKIFNKAGAAFKAPLKWLKKPAQEQDNEPPAQDHDKKQPPGPAP